MTKNYEPNYNDPRVVKKIRSALSFVNAYISDKKEKPIAQSQINKYFGQSQHDLSKFLKETLLVCTDGRYSKEAKLCKKYIKRTAGVKFLLDKLKINDKIAAKTLQDMSISQIELDHADALQALKNGTLEYNEKSSRYWNSLQNIPKSNKQIVLARCGFNHQYDTECSAPTLLHQYAQSLGMDAYLFAIRKYLNNKVECREQLAQDANISVHVAKRVINALFCGAKVSTNDRHSIFHLVNCSKSAIAAIKASQFIIELKSDIKQVWDQMIESRILIRNTRISARTGNIVNIPLTSKKKWIVYFNQEQKVIDSMVDYFNHFNIKYFLEHDGWTLDQHVDNTTLINFIYQETGYKVKLDYQFITDNNHDEDGLSPSTSPVPGSFSSLFDHQENTLDSLTATQQAPIVYNNKSVADQVKDIFSSSNNGTLKKSLDSLQTNQPTPIVYNKPSKSKDIKSTNMKMVPVGFNTNQYIMVEV